MVEIDTTPRPEHLKRIRDRSCRLEDGQATTVQRLIPMSSERAAFHADDAVRDATIAGINLRLDRIERRLDLRDEA